MILPERVFGRSSAQMIRFGRANLPIRSATTARMRPKLGLGDDVREEQVAALGDDLLGLMTSGHVDHTSFLRSLGDAARGDAEPARAAVLDLPAFDGWLARWRALAPDADTMDRHNPAYVPRNHLVEEALAAATAGDLAPFERLLEVVTRPFDVRPGLERYTEPASEEFGSGYQTFCGT